MVAKDRKSTSKKKRSQIAAEAASGDPSKGGLEVPGIREAPSDPDMGPAAISTAS